MQRHVTVATYSGTAGDVTMAQLAPHAAGDGQGRDWGAIAGERARGSGPGRTGLGRGGEGGSSSGGGDAFGGLATWLATWLACDMDVSVPRGHGQRAHGSSSGGAAPAPRMTSLSCPGPSRRVTRATALP